VNEPVVGECEQGGAGDCASTFSGSTRAHILSAMVDLVVTEGYAAVTVDRLTARAAVSPDDFERSFADLESCFLAAFDVGAEEAIRRVTAAAFHADVPDPMRSIEIALERGLRALLECVSNAPALAHLCLIEVAAVGARGLARREATLERFARLIEIHLAALSQRPPPLASEMVVGGVHEILERKVRRGDTGRLAELAPALTQVWLPVLRGGAIVR
jgi:AcrR family transcriptional regulator